MRLLILCVFCVLAGCSKQSPEIAAEPIVLGPPCAVAADENAVFLGWRNARGTDEIVACEPGGRVLWGHHHSGAGESGVKAMAADGGVVFVLADADGKKIYRLDAKTGKPLPWEGRAEPDLLITALWGDPNAKLDRADYLAADNGRLYVTFAADQFAAVLDAKTGAYIITLSGPQLGPMAFSTTPMIDPQTGQQKVIDFGVAVIAEHGLAYFLMEHDPTWVMMSITRWLQPNERITALALTGDAMKTDKLTIYTALGEPHHQVQLRPADSVESFTTTVGAPGGGQPGTSNPEAMRDIRAIAVDALGQLWVAEMSGETGRFSVWKTEGKAGILLHENFSPSKL